MKHLNVVVFCFTKVTKAFDTYFHLDVCFPSWIDAMCLLNDNFWNIFGHKCHIWKLFCHRVLIQCKFSSFPYEKSLNALLSSWTDAICLFNLDLHMHTVAIWKFTFHKKSGFVRVILKANFNSTYKPNSSMFWSKTQIY